MTELGGPQRAAVRPKMLCFQVPKCTPQGHSKMRCNTDPKYTCTHTEVLCYCATQPGAPRLVQLVAGAGCGLQSWARKKSPNRFSDVLLTSTPGSFFSLSQSGCGTRRAQPTGQEQAQSPRASGLKSRRCSAGAKLGGSAVSAESKMDLKPNTPRAAASRRECAASSRGLRMHPGASGKLMHIALRGKAERQGQPQSSKKGVGSDLMTCSEQLGTTHWAEKR